MESAEYKKQYDEYLARAEKALSQACEHYLPEESDVCRAARYSLLGGGKRIRAVLVLAVLLRLDRDLRRSLQQIARAPRGVSGCNHV